MNYLLNSNYCGNIECASCRYFHACMNFHRTNVFGSSSSSASRRQKQPIDLSSVIRRPLNQDSNIPNQREPQRGLIASASARNNAAPNSNSLIEGGLELRTQSPLIAGGKRFGGPGSQQRQSANSKNDIEEVIVREAYKEDNLIVIKWDSETSNILGFRVVYRLFGKPEFKQGPPLGPSEREFRIKNVPANVSKHIIDASDEIRIFVFNLSDYLSPCM